MRVLGLLLLGAATSVAAHADAVPAGPTTLHYRAYVAGTPVGSAEVHLSVTDSGYRILGEASSNGWLKSFASWRNEFSAAGALDGPHRALSEFAYFEQNGANRRDVSIRDGVLKVLKNGKPRAERASPSGLDLLSALFVKPSCALDESLHTGRRVYRLTRLEHDGSRCRFEVVDEDEDRFQFELLLTDHEGLVVPARVTVHTWLTGRVELIDVPAEPPEPADGG